LISSLWGRYFRSHLALGARERRALSTFRKETDDGDELELHGAEVAALMNLVATDTLVEEAASLIPSLSRFPEAAIDEILDLIRSTMIRIVS
jgi:DNA-directed RNA polymerase II subunit RPB4